MRRLVDWLVARLDPLSAHHPFDWIGHALLAASLTLMFGRDGAAGAIGFYVLREAEQWIFRDPSPWWDHLIDALVPTLAALAVLALSFGHL